MVTVAPRPMILPILLAFSFNLAHGADWPQWRGPNRDGVWSETGIIDRFSEGQLKPVWRSPVASGYTGPTVAEGRIYVMDRSTDPKQVERIQCFDQQTGASLWSYTYDAIYRNVGYGAGPRASVTIHKDRAYALGAMGHIHCLDAAKGNILWSNDLFESYSIDLPIWGIAASPLIYDDLIILQIGGTPDACIIALDRATGQERWRALSDKASYAAPILTQQAGKTVLIVWTGDSVAGLNPTTGALHWQHPHPPKRMIIGVATPVAIDNHVLVTSFYDGALLLELATDRLAISKVWHRVGENERDTDGIHSTISTPLWLGDHIYGIDSYGMLRCLRADTGDRVWADRTAVRLARWSTAHLIPQRGTDRIWILNEEGELLLARLSPQGFEVISRTHIIEPTTDQLNRRGGVTWSHPAFSNGHIYLRNGKELIAIDLRKSIDPKQ